MSHKREKAKRQLVRKVLQLFVEELRAVLKKNWKRYFEGRLNARKPCKTCAFCPSTDRWTGADATAINLQKAIERGEPFYCHENMQQGPQGWVPDPKNLVLCAGYDMIRFDPDTKTAFGRAAAKSFKDPALLDFYQRAAGTR